MKTSNNNESVPDTTEVGGNDDDGDSGGWTCLQCEEENEEAFPDGTYIIELMEVQMMIDSIKAAKRLNILT